MAVDFPCQYVEVDLVVPPSWQLFRSQLSFSTKSHFPSSVSGDWNTNKLHTTAPPPTPLKHIPPIHKSPHSTHTLIPAPQVGEHSESLNQKVSNCSEYFSLQICFCLMVFLICAGRSDNLGPCQVVDYIFPLVHCRQCAHGFIKLFSSL